MKGGFVAKLSKHHGSSLPYDQSLEKAYNKPAKVSGGVIGVTRKKECMLKYDLTKQEKEMYVDFLSTLSSSSCSDEHDEFNVHYEFNSTTTAKDFSHVNSLIDCILSIRGNPFALPSATNKHSPLYFCNLASGETISCKKYNFLTTCISAGEDLYRQYKTDRLINKTIKLFAPIQ